jgi:hypothetical protein
MRFFDLRQSLIFMLMCCGSLACESIRTDGPSAQHATSFKLPNLVAPRDSVEVDIVFVDRPVGDPLLGNTLWREVAQVGTLTPEQRATVREAGLLVGQVGSSPPEALQTLLNLTDEELDRQRREANGLPRTAARRVALPAGAETEIWSNEPVARRIVTLANNKQLELYNLRGILRLKAERTQEGWARLDFVPELHHGETGTRPFAGVTGWTYRTAQEVIPCYAERFSAVLNIGEMLLLTCDRDRPGTLGQSLFQFEDSTGLKQRLVVVRLADLREIVPKRVRVE